MKDTKDANREMVTLLPQAHTMVYRTVLFQMTLNGLETFEFRHN